jgi:hypothetical protein
MYGDRACPAYLRELQDVAACPLLHCVSGVYGDMVIEPACRAGHIKALKAPIAERWAP